MKFFYIFLVFSIFFEEIIGVLPPSIPRCRRDHPNMGDCIVQAINVLKPGFVSGDLGGGFRVPSLEPFHIKQLNVGRENGLKILLTDLNVYGASNFIIDKLRVNINDLRFDILLTLPKFDLYAKYKMNLNFLGSAIVSNGDLHTQHTNPRAKITMKAKRITKDGKESVKFEPFDIKLQHGGFKILKITNLFGGNKVLEEIVINLLEGTSDSFSTNIYPILQVELSNIFTELANSIVENASYDELFPV